MNGNTDGMIMRLGTFAIGVAIGATMVLFLNRPAGIANETVQPSPVETSESDGLGPAARIAKSAIEDESGNSDSRPEEGLSSDGSRLAKDSIRIPSAYRDLVDPIPRHRPSPLEIHAIFEKEPRDETWAAAMEAGIRDHYARFGAAEKTVVEYVECRSKYCEIAGFREKDFSGVTGRVFSDMTKSGWWQADGGDNYISGHADGVDRFVIIVTRYRLE